MAINWITSFFKPKKPQNASPSILENAFMHVLKHSETFGLNPNDFNYFNKVHEILDQLHNTEPFPGNVEIQEDSLGQKRYYIHPGEQNAKGIFIALDASGAPKTLFAPKDQYQYFITRPEKLSDEPLKNSLCRVCAWPFDAEVWGEGVYPTYLICPSCGCEAGNEDYTLEGIRIYRQQWIEHGMKWWYRSKKPPKFWNPKKQLKNLPPEFV